MKNNRVLQTVILIVLLILLVLAILLIRSRSEPPPTEAPTTQAVVTEPPTQPSPTETPVPTATATPTPQRNPPSGPILPSNKISLDLETEPPFPVQTVVGFRFPDGQQAIKAAPKESVSPSPDSQEELTNVGIVEIGDGAADIQPGLYSVAIDLASEKEEVNGLLVSVKDSSITYPQHFSRIPQQINPERDPASVPDPAVSIRSDSVCFVVGIGVELNTPVATTLPKEIQPPTSKNYFRYCSISETYLSTNIQFSGSYEGLKAQVSDAAAALGFQRELDLDLSISELEDSPNIEACNTNPDLCQSDIFGAPVSSFYSDYDKAKSEAGSENFVVTAGFVRVQKQLNINGIVVEVGSYQVEYWFKPDGTFIGATFYGRRDGSEGFTEQQIPAGEPAFLNADGSLPLTSDISAWKLCNRCLIRQTGVCS